MKFTKEFIKNNKIESILEEVDSHGESSMTVIFKTEDGKHYETYYNDHPEYGITWYGEHPEGALIECREVHQVEKTVKVWEPVK